MIRGTRRNAGTAAAAVIAATLHLLHPARAETPATGSPGTRIDPGVFFDPTPVDRRGGSEAPKRRDAPTPSPPAPQATPVTPRVAPAPPANEPAKAPAPTAAPPPVTTDRRLAPATGTPASPPKAARATPPVAGSGRPVASRRRAAPPRPSARTRRPSQAPRPREPFKVPGSLLPTQ